MQEMCRLGRSPRQIKNIKLHIVIDIKVLNNTLGEERTKQINMGELVCDLEERW